MKKHLTLLLTALAFMALALTACGINDEPVNKRSAIAQINNRAVDGNNHVTFSQNNATIEVNFTDMTIQLSTGYKDFDSTSHTLNTPALKLVPVAGLIYRFNSGATPINGIADFDGYIDLATWMLSYSFTANGGYQVFAGTQPTYTYATTTVTNPDNGNHYSQQQSQYMFAIDATGKKCTMLISNFAPNINGVVQAYQIYWSGLTLAPTATGYHITASEAESSVKGTHTITDLTIALNNQGRVIDGSFKCDDLDFKVTGDMFPMP